MLELFSLRTRALSLAFGFLACAAPLQAQVFTPVNIPELAAHVAFSTGASWVDFDGDGDLDLYVVTAFSGNNDNVLYRNDGGDSFVRVLGVPVVQDTADTVCSSWADVDNDGDLDAYVTGLGTRGSRLYRRTGASWVLDDASGISGVALKGVGCAWGDYDRDGHVDLVVSTITGALGMVTGNRLFRNLGNGTFQEILGSPISATGNHHNPTWADYDGDGDLDLFFATGPVGGLGPDHMYRNRLVETGIADFEAITTGILATDSRDSQVLSWADVDNDGDLDCYAINYTEVPNQLYKNNGASGFSKITTGAIVTDMGAGHGVAWGDFDNDGDLDVHVARDNSNSDRYYRNEGNFTFTSVSTPATTPFRSAYGVAAADYDQDGDLDLFLPTARSEGPSVLYRNDLANGNHWLELACEGQPSNRSAIGLRVRVRAVIGGQPRWQMREIASNTGYGGQSALVVHFGLGGATVADTVRFEWPSGEVDVLTNVAADTLISFEEGQSTADVPLPTDRVTVTDRIRLVPNPLARPGAVAFWSPQDAPARVTLHDMQGRCVRTLFDGMAPAGWRTEPIDPAWMPASGMYWVRLSTALGTWARPVVTIR